MNTILTYRKIALTMVNEEATQIEEMQEQLNDAIDETEDFVKLSWKPRPKKHSRK